MTCETAEKLILLQDSGELSDQDAAAVESHLRRCDKCRTYQRSLAAGRLAFGAMQEPDEQLVREVLQDARMLAPRRSVHLHIGLKPALAIAASLVIAAGLFFSAFSPGKVGMEWEVTDAQLMDSDDQVVDIMYSGLSEDDLAFNFLMTFEEI